MKPILKKMINYILPLAVIYLLFCLAIFLSQRSLIYHPVAAHSNFYPRQTMESGGATLQISVNEVGSSRAVIYFGGNAEDVSTTMPDLCELFHDCDVFAMHYRGYGGSQGKPREELFHADAQLLFERISANHSVVIVVGRSLGSGVATRLASKNPISRLILVTPFDSLANVAAAHFRFVPVRWLMWDRYESWKLAPKISAPVLVLAAAQDEIIPLESTQRLVDSFRPGQCQFEIIDPADHNSLELPKHIIRDFVAERSVGRN